MSLMREYLNHSNKELENEFQKLIAAYNKYRKSFLLVYAAKMDVHRPDASLSMDDKYTIHDLLRNQGGSTLDVLLETPGGSGPAAQDIVDILRKNFETVNFVIAGEAKSAGTILALSGDEIFMTETGSLGPIDAQMKIGRSLVSSSDYLEMVEQIRKRAEQHNRLDPFDAAMVAQISPGEIAGVIHANKFAQDLVEQWLPEYKFKNWDKTEGSGKPVTMEDKKTRAKDIARELAANSSRWRIHGKSIKIDDLKNVLKIHRVEDDPSFSDIVYRIHTVCRLLFSKSPSIKVFATEVGMLFKGEAVAPITLPGKAIKAHPNSPVRAEVRCPKCSKHHAIIHDPQKKKPLVRITDQGNIKPLEQKNLVIKCHCGEKIDLTPILKQVELDTGRKILTT